MENAVFVAAPASDWNIRSSTPDIYGPLAAWIDGTYGAGQTAHDGTRWAGVYSDGTKVEAFDQVLSTPLVAGQSFALSAYLLEGDPPTFTVGAGGYEVWLGTISTIDVLLGVLGTTTAKGVWQYRDFSFVAPVNVARLTSIIFSPMPVASLDACKGSQ
ncbi:MAG: hypothetical protein O6944_08150 [Gammaproteobacteria bacterium]|nr:hypothetical protein [Gammaproteobacteria bacterium]